MSGDDAAQVERWMRRALALARRGEGWVEPNPMVGAVVVKDGRIIGEGWHRRFGQAHAEVEALRDCARRGDDPAGAHMLVTLEPCCHHGKTGPCTEAILAAGITAITAAMADPFPEVSGKGLTRLKDAGLTVAVGVCAGEARDLNAPYLKRLKTGRPWVIGKWAQTLDGRTAASDGDSRWISNEASRRLVHRLRSRVDGVMVGIGTALRDDPLLTCRSVPRRRIARRIVIDPSLRLPLDSQLASSLDAASLSIAADAAVLDADRSRASAWRARGVELIPIRNRRIGPVLEHLVQTHRMTNVLVEGGAGLMGSLLDEQLVDQLLVFVAPKLLQDDRAVPAVRGLARRAMSDARPLELRHLRRVGDDVMLDYRVGVINP